MVESLGPAFHAQKLAQFRIIAQTSRIIDAHTARAETENDLRCDGFRGETTTFIFARIEQLALSEFFPWPEIFSQSINAELAAVGCGGLGVFEDFINVRGFFVQNGRDANKAPNGDLNLRRFSPFLISFLLHLQNWEEATLWGLPHHFQTNL